jgi:hypothetical protein
MNYRIVCVGGTGQMVLHYYTQLYLLGKIRHPFEAVVVDTDEIIESVKASQGFLRGLQYTSQAGEALGAQVPTIEDVQVRPKGKDTAFKALTGRDSWDDLHPAQAFFNKNTLGQNLKQGLFARPALSSVVAREVLKSKALTPKPDTTVVIVGSIFGGTGGGLTAPITDEIRSRVRRQNIDNVKIRAVLFGEYFTPDPDRIEGGVVRFQSNQTLVLRSIRESLEEVQSFYIVGGPGFKSSVERIPEQEKKGEHIPWPETEASPFWRGAQAVEYLLTETTKDTPEEFAAREVQSNFKSPVALSAARQSLEQRIILVEKFLNKEAVVRMSHDPWVTSIWGQGMRDVVANFWNIAAKMEGGTGRVKSFPHTLQGALEAIWRGGEEASGLRKVFPVITKSHTVLPRSMRRIPWPTVQEGTWDRDLFDGTGKAAMRAAATILFFTLREGV